MLQKMALSVFLGVCKTSVISTIVDVAGNHLVDRL